MNNEPFSLFVYKLNFLAVGEQELVPATMEEAILKYPEMEEFLRALDSYIQSKMLTYKASGFINIDTPDSPSDDESYFNWWPTVVGAALFTFEALRRMWNCKNIISRIEELERFIQGSGGRLVRHRRVNPGARNSSDWGWRFDIIDMDHIAVQELIRLMALIANMDECFKKHKELLQKLFGRWRTPDGTHLFPVLDYTSVAALALVTAYITSSATSLWETILHIPSSITLQPDWLGSFSAYVVETGDNISPEIINAIADLGEVVDTYQGGILTGAAFVIIAGAAISSGVITLPVIGVGATLDYLFSWGLVSGAVTLGGLDG